MNYLRKVSLNPILWLGTNRLLTFKNDVVPQSRVPHHHRLLSRQSINLEI